MSSSSYSDFRDAVERLLGCAVLFHGAENLGDLADIDLATLLQESGLGDVADGIEIANTAAALRSEIQIGAEFCKAIEGLDDRRRVIARKRTYARDPVKLAALGHEFGVSRERARQLEVRLRRAVDLEVAHLVKKASTWLERAVGSAADPVKFERILSLLVDDAPSEWRTAAEVAVMAEGGYEVLDGVVGNRAFKDQIARARRFAPDFANEAGVIDEEALREAVGAADTPEWEALTRNARLVRIDDNLVVRDTRRARVFLALQAIGEPSSRDTIAVGAELADNSSLSSLLSSDPLFVRFTKDKWGLSAWTDEPYEGVVEAIVKRIEEADGEVEIDLLVAEIPAKFEVLPATVRNYIGTRKFEIHGDKVRVVARPGASIQDLSSARDVVWTRDGTPVLRFTVGPHHLKGNSQKISVAVAQHLGVGLDGSVKIPFVRPRGVDDASVIWRSYDPNGPEMGRLREALLKAGIEPGQHAHVVLRREGLRLFANGADMLKEKP